MVCVDVGSLVGLVLKSCGHGLQTPFTVPKCGSSPGLLNVPCPLTQEQTCPGLSLCVLSTCATAPENPEGI